jgi:hypothetical protein
VAKAVGRSPQKADEALLKSLGERMGALEQKFNENVRILYGNDQQFKAGLDASETNQRAIAKVVEAAVSTIYNGDVGVVKKEGEKDGTVNWQHYYDEVTAEMKSERLAQYKIALGQLMQKADMVEGVLPKFEERIKDELGNPSNSDTTAKAKSAAKFINDVRAQIVRVRKADEASKAPGAEVQIQEFDDTDTFFNYVIGMHRRMEAEEKKKAEDSAKASAPVDEAPAIVEASEEDVRVFGG